MLFCAMSSIQRHAANHVATITEFADDRAILRATAIRAVLPPIRFAKRMPQAFDGENR